MKANFIGKYEGIKFRFTYKEFVHPETEELTKAFYDWRWPGRIPTNKELAEKGIQELFSANNSNDNIIFKVHEDNEDTLTDAVEEEALMGELNIGDDNL